MDRDELKLMLNTEQGLQLVQQVMELSVLRNQQEAQLAELEKQQNQATVVPKEESAVSREVVEVGQEQDPTSSMSDVDLQQRRDMETIMLTQFEYQLPAHATTLPLVRKLSTACRQGHTHRRGLQV